MAAIKEEKTIQFLFNCCLCTPAVKLNIEWQMALLVVKTNMDITDEIALLTALHWVENFKPFNKHLRLLARHIGPMTKKIPADELLLQMNGIWGCKRKVTCTRLGHVLFQGCLA